MKIGSKVRIRTLPEDLYERERIKFPTYDSMMKKFYGKIFKIRSISKDSDNPADYVYHLDNDYSYLAAWIEDINKKPATKADFLKALK